MKVLVISDTHGNFPSALTACDLAEPFDALIHLGDGCGDADLLRSALDIPVIAVSGNCDVGINAPRELLWECEGKKFLLVHGDIYRVKSGLALLEQRARELGADAVLYGHTHVAMQEERSGLLILNPGTLIKSGRFQSYAILTVDTDSISARILEI
ncbi:MAG TPA: metallophosphoesterase [Desulfuromonadales bacterium]|nr:metallophosphoesterase [Desulfuromonadales bacterium]